MTPLKKGDQKIVWNHLWVKEQFIKLIIMKCFVTSTKSRTFVPICERKNMPMHSNPHTSAQIPSNKPPVFQSNLLFAKKKKGNDFNQNSYS